MSGHLQMLATRSFQSSETHGGIATQSLNHPIIEITPDSHNGGSSSIFDRSSLRTPAYPSNAHKRHLSANGDIDRAKRQKDNDVSTITVQPAQAMLTTRPTKSPEVCALDDGATMQNHTDELPQVLKSQLENWCSFYGDETPPCVANTRIRPSCEEDDAEWIYVPTGEKLEVTIHSMIKTNNRRPSSIRKQSLIVARGATKGPFIISYSIVARHRTGRDVRFKIWLAGDSRSAAVPRDAKGYEIEPSVIKRKFNGNTCTEPEVSYTQSEVSSDEEEPVLNSNSDSRELRNRMQQSLKSHPDTVNLPDVSAVSGPVAPSAISSERIPEATVAENFNTPETHQIRRNPSSISNPKLARTFQNPADRAGQTHVCQPTHEADPLTAKIKYVSSSSQQQASHSDRSSNRGREAYLRPHIRENTEFCFMSFDAKSSSRVRPYHACETTKTLFGQARSARAFDPSPEVANVLELQVVNAPHVITLMEEDDLKYKEDDYGTFLSDLSDLACWKLTDGQWTGSCVIKVKALD